LPLPFDDRTQAGKLLGNALGAFLRSREFRQPAIVLGLARGGVPVAFQVASRLGLPLDVIVARKIGVPWQPELAMGAIAGAARVLDDRVIRELAIPSADVEAIVARETAEMRRREELYRAGKLPLDLSGKLAILIDDGLAMGTTMLAAIRFARHAGAAKVICGVPVGSAEATRRVRAEADSVVCLATPHPFVAVGEWYRHFGQVSDAEVENLLAGSRHSPAAA